MSNFHKTPGTERISHQTINVAGDTITVGLWGYKDFGGNELIVTNQSDDLTILPAGTVGESTLWKISVKVASKAGKKFVKDRIVAITGKWETWDYFDINFDLEAGDSQTGLIQPLRPVYPMGSWVNTPIWIPDLASLAKDLVFKWLPAQGSGSVHYFELQSDVVPNWFGVLVPHGVTSYEHVHLFFHPTPSQAGYHDANYSKKLGWSGVFHYMTDVMAAQFCAANTGQILIMPLMTTASASTCGILAEHWESIFSQILGHLAVGNTGQTPQPGRISSVVVSSFSSGIVYSYVFRHTAKLGGRLHGVVDFDGSFSTNRRFSALTGPPAIKLHQSFARAQDLSSLARQGNFPVPAARWGGDPGPYSVGGFTDGPLALHGLIPQLTMYAGARMTAIR